MRDTEDPSSEDVANFMHNHSTPKERKPIAQEESPDSSKVRTPTSSLQSLALIKSQQLNSPYQLDFELSSAPSAYVTFSKIVPTDQATTERTIGNFGNSHLTAHQILTLRLKKCERVNHLLDLSPPPSSNRLNEEGQHCNDSWEGYSQDNKGCHANNESEQ